MADESRTNRFGFELIAPDILKEATPEEAYMMNKYLHIHKIDTYFQACLIVNDQFFDIGCPLDTKFEASWMCHMLAKALLTIRKDGE